MSTRILLVLRKDYTASLSFLSAVIFTTRRAGLAAKVISFPVKGLVPFRKITMFLGKMGTALNA